ncbi:hydrogenase maturation nickel metallochaperone HypA [Halioxenophilus sp. WMMB6]|uniref:hydrogenase maturation nickel metallochaperone HypA n=1 Tax=Halioxenophilus sp. WMMB6 TaxID=3073815 RepID=UPI00295E648B|nr:hydrogenase maturation nickel metallochaperone HypA [Halioxenophilus sp. WMMB6]
MHEMALSESILEILTGAAEQQGFARVKQVWLEVGQFAGVEKSALAFSFEVVARGSLAEGATLTMIDLPGLAWCLPCAEVVVIKERFSECPNCGSSQLQITAGEEFRIKELEVE